MKPRQTLKKVVPKEPYRVLRAEVDDNDDHSLVIRFPKPGGEYGKLRIARAMLVQPQKAKAHLASKGAVLPADTTALLNRLQAAVAPRTVRVTRRGGWHGDRFVTPYGVFPTSARPSEVTFDPDSVQAQERKVSGTLEEYRSGIGRFLTVSDHLLFVTLLGLTAPLAARIGRSQSFAVCLCGESSTGKSLSLRLAQSLVGAASESALINYGDTPGTVLNAIPSFGGLCVSFGDVKADLSSKDAMQKLRTLVFSAVSGTSRQRLNAERKLPGQYTIPLLSTERPVAELFAEAGLRHEGGEVVRILDIPVPPREQGGIFSAGLTPTGQLAAELDAFISRFHGTMMPDWIAKILSIETPEMLRLIEAKEATFMTHVGPLEGHYERAAKHFAFVAAVGGLAVKLRVLPLTSQQVQQSVLGMFVSWHSAVRRGNVTEMARWRIFFSLVADEAKVPRARIGVALTPAPALGFRRKEKEGDFIFLRSEALAAALPTGFLQTAVVPELLSSKCIQKSSTGENTVVVSQNGLPRGRYFRITVNAFQAMRDRILSPQGR